jgi:hypothetical protein
MATLVLIADSEATEPLLGPNSAARLGRIGVSHITLLRDKVSTAVVLEGWALKADAAAEAVRAVFADGGSRVRTFHEIEHVVISGEKEGDPHEPHPESIGANAGSRGGRTVSG